MATSNIVMVEPEIPQNTGNVARTCAATGARLHLVGPMGFQIDDKKLKRAGLDYWHMLDITMYSSLSDFFEKNPLADQTGYYFSTKAQHTHTEVIYPDNCYLFFGKETAGLPESLLYKPKKPPGMPSKNGKAPRRYFCEAQLIYLKKHARRNVWFSLWRSAALP